MNPTDQLIADAKRYQSIHEFSQHAAAEKGIELLDHFIARVRELEAERLKMRAALDPVAEWLMDWNSRNVEAGLIQPPTNTERDNHIIECGDNPTEQALAGLTELADSLESGKPLEECVKITHVRLLPPLVWTDAKPTVPGTYLRRDLGETRPERWEIVVAEADESHGIARKLAHECGGYGWVWPLPDGEYAPIPTPTEAK